MNNLKKQAHEQSKRTAQTLVNLAKESGDKKAQAKHQKDLDKHKDPDYMSGTHKQHYKQAKKEGKSSLYVVAGLILMGTVLLSGCSSPETVELKPRIEGQISPEPIVPSPFNIEKQQLHEERAILNPPIEGQISPEPLMPEEVRMEKQELHDGTGKVQMQMQEIHEAK